MPTLTNPGLSTGQLALSSTIVTLPAAQLRALHTTPITLVPAPGLGKVVINILTYLSLHFGTAPFQPSGADGVIVGYQGAQSQVILGPINSFLELSASTIFYNPANLSTVLIPASQASNLPILISAESDFTFGKISTTTLAAGGLGYAPNDTGVISTGSANATYQVLTVGGGGAVLTYSITAPGTAYTTGNGVATATGGAQPGAGAGFTVNITAVAQGDGLLQVTTYYTIVPA
jgi:hypothetical protein